MAVSTPVPEFSSHLVLPFPVLHLYNPLLSILPLNSLTYFFPSPSLFPLVWLSTKSYLDLFKKFPPFSPSYLPTAATACLLTQKSSKTCLPCEWSTNFSLWCYSSSTPAKNHFSFTSCYLSIYFLCSWLNMTNDTIDTTVNSSNHSYYYLSLMLSWLPNTTNLMNNYWTIIEWRIIEFLLCAKNCA